MVYSYDEYGSGFRNWERLLGGGGGSTERRERKFFILTFKSSAEPPFPDDDKDSFFQTSVKTNRNFLFTAVDLETDSRLRNDLHSHEGGAEQYEKIESSTPAFLISNFPMRDLNLIQDMKILPIKDYVTDVQKIYDEIGIHSKTARRRAINFLKRLNRYVKLEPNNFGVGPKGNEMIGDLIKKFEDAMP